MIGQATHCTVCGLRLSTASEWCLGTRDGDHRPKPGGSNSSDERSQS